MSGPTGSFDAARIRVVSFDVWQTLIKPNRHYAASRADGLRTCLGLSEDRLDEVTAVIGRLDDGFNRLTDTTGLQYGTRERLVRLARHFGTKPTDEWVRATTAILREHFAANPPEPAEPGLPQLLRAIKASGRQVVCISNTGFTDGAHVRLGLRALDLLSPIDVMLFSDEFGHAKPSAEIFVRAAELTGVPSGSILHVGDNYAADYQGARMNGFQARHLDPLVPDSGITVSSLSQLLTVLEISHV